MNILGNIPFLQSPAAQLLQQVLPQLGQLGGAQSQDSSDPISGMMSALLSNPSTSALMGGLGGGGLMSSIISVACPELALATALMPMAKDILGYGLGGIMKFFGPKRHHHKKAESTETQQETFMSQAEGILSDPNLSVEEKLMRLASLAADSIDDKVEKEMKEWSKELDSTMNKSGGKGSQGGSKASKMDKADRNHYFNMKQMEIQQLLQKKRELMSTVSQVSKALFSLHQQIIANMR